MIRRIETEKVKLKIKEYTGETDLFNRQQSTNINIAKTWGSASIST